MAGPGERAAQLQEQGTRTCEQPDTSARPGPSRKRLTGYHAQSRIEAQMRRLKAFGERIIARDPDRQAAEVHTRIALVNRFSALAGPR